MHKLTKSKIYGLLHNIGISYANSFIGFIIFLLLARYFGADNFTLVAIGIAIGGFITPLLDLGSARTFVRDAVATNGPGELENMILASYGMRLTVITLLIIPLIIFTYVYTDNLESAVSVVTVALWIGSMGLYPTSWFDYCHDTVTQNFCVMAERIATLISIIVIMSLKLTEYIVIVVCGLLLLIRLMSISYQVWLWWNKYSKGKFSLWFSLPAPNTAGINITLTVALIFNAFFIYGNQLILGKYNNGAELSAFSLAFQLVGLIFLFQALAIRLLNRSISEITRLKKNIIKYVMYHGAILAGISMFLTIIVSIVSMYMPRILGDSRYELIPDFMPLLSVWIIIVGGGQIVTQYLLDMKQERVYLTTSILGGLVALILGFIFIPAYGAYALIIILIGVHSSTILVGFVRISIVNNLLYRK